MNRSVMFGTILLAGLTGMARAGEVGYVEDFALAKDRAIALQQLIPGTEDFYYYHCLHFQNTRQFDRVEPLLKKWEERHQESPRVREIRHRQALLTYELTPQQTLEYLRKTLNLRFDHQRETMQTPPGIPSVLDPDLIRRETLTAAAHRRHNNLDGFADSALEWLVKAELSPDHRRELLKRLARPDHEGMVDLVLADLDHRGSQGFGSLPIHGRLLLYQLQECCQKKPALLNDPRFVNCYLIRLLPSNDHVWWQDTQLKTEFLDRLWKFVGQLPPTYNSLKAHVLHHRLVLDRSQGIFDKPRFMAYIQLPRSAQYVNQEHWQQLPKRSFAADLTADFQQVTRLPVVGKDEPLIRSYLQHFFLTETTTTPYEEYLDQDYLKEVLAETKVLYGQGEPEQWSALLSPAQFQALRQRVEIDFAYTNKHDFSPDEPIQLDIAVKNVSTLIVKTYEINTLNYFRQNQHDINTDIHLDGLVANHERTLTLEESPLRRVSRHLEFPHIQKRGIYIVDIIGNGKSSRALIRIGRLHSLARTSTAGHVITVLDEQNQRLTDASLLLGGHEYRSDDDGTITVPFSTEPGRKPVVLVNGGFASLDYLQHTAEDYELAAGIYVDRESLLSGRTAQLILRPTLYLNGTPVSLRVLKDVKLVITSTDSDGVATSKEVGDFQLHEDRESLHEFTVPQRLSQLTFQLKAKVRNLSQNKDVDLAVQETFQLNGIDQTEKIEDLHLTRFSDRYVLELLGKNGEPKSHRPVHVQLKHHDFQDAIDVTLQTDLQGRIALGSLEDIDLITATGPQEAARSWKLLQDRHSYYANLHGREGNPIHVPFMTEKEALTRADLSLLELRGDEFLADRFDAVRLNNGMLTITGLTRGDYDLLLKRSGRRIRLRITEGPVLDQHVLGNPRQLELRGGEPLQISRAAVGNETLDIQLANFGKFSRVHLFATRYHPAFSASRYLGRIVDCEPSFLILGTHHSSFVAGRQLGDEYRYIIDRKYAEKYSGNMLQRPSLLLNPWSLRRTETGQQDAKAGEQFAESAPAAEPTAGRADHDTPTVESVGDFANLDFLARQSAVMINLVPDETGRISLDLQELASYQYVQILAVDPDDTALRTVYLPEHPTELLDLRLTQGLDPAQHLTQQKQVTVVSPGESFRLDDIKAARWEVYDSLARVHSLLATLSGNATLAEFAFVVQWDQLSPEEKRAKYSKYACHELNYFLFRKDPQFFQTVVLPYLQHKKDKTFLDQWLLGEDIADYTSPWRYAHLNTVERILLAQRLDHESPQTRRAIREALDLLPPDVDRFNFLFNTAAQGSSLDATNALGVPSSPYLNYFRAELTDRIASPAKPAGVGGDAAKLPAVAGRLATDAALGEDKNALLGEVAEQEELGRKSTPRAGGERARFGRAGQALEADHFFADDLARRKEIRRLYRAMDKTREWAENNYYHLPIADQNSELVPVNVFWNDYAKHDWQRPFLSGHFPYACRNFTEMMFALAVLDLPFASAEHKTQIEGSAMTVVPVSPLVIFHEDIRPAAKADIETPILVSQNFFQPDDRYQYVDNQRQDKYVSDEFLMRTVYGCQVVVTNPTSSPRRLDVLIQLPAGSLPVSNAHVTRSVPIELEPFHTKTIEYFFYFPQAGQFQHYPVHVSQDRQLLANAAAIPFHVVEQLSQSDQTSWDYVSQFGSSEDVLSYLKQHNLKRTQLDRIAFRMRDREFFDAAITLLHDNHAYDATLWSYAIHHNRLPEIQQYLQHLDGFVMECGPCLESKPLTVDPVARGTYQHLDYRPFVNARAHQLGARRQIVNERLLAQYHQLLAIIAHQPALTSDQWMAVTYYLLLQDRVEEALDCYERIDADALPMRLQYDYLTAYLDFFGDEISVADQIADQYAEYPVDRWREAFEAIHQQVREIQGKESSVVDPENREQSQSGLAASEPSFDFQVDGQQVRVRYQNLQTIRVNYYLMDIELLFSRNPFVQQFSGHFSFIQPNETRNVELPTGENSIDFELPESLQNGNLLVEIQGGGQTKSEAHYANSMNVQIVENYGQLQVSHQTTHKPLNKVYVKAYARMKDGSVQFYKDGYTDLRGRFDYSSLNTSQLDTVDRFALLVCSEQHGAVVREVRPPQR
jgi:hypothetical protein